jgi:hypothetical protein
MDGSADIDPRNNNRNPIASYEGKAYPESACDAKDTTIKHEDGQLGKTDTCGVEIHVRVQYFEDAFEVGCGQHPQVLAAPVLRGDQATDGGACCEKLSPSQSNYAIPRFLIDLPIRRE